MDYTTITFGLNALVSVVSATAAVLIVWSKMRTKQEILELELDSLKKSQDKVETEYKSDLASVRASKKELGVQLNLRISDLKSTVDRNRDKSDQSITDLTALINEMKVEIIREIHANVNKK